MTSDAEPKLARVTYLPGVQPPSAPLVESAVDSRAVDSPAVDPSAVDPSVADSSAADLSAVGSGVAGLVSFDASRVPLDAIPGLVKASEISAPSAAFDEDRGGTELTPKQERSSRAHNVGLNALARRGVSSAEMTALLVRREIDQDAIEDEIGRLEGVGLLDDTELARNLVRTLRDRKGLGRSAVVAELRRRKIEPDAIDEVVEETYADDAADELTRAREVAIKRAQQLRSLDPETARRRLGAYLMRRGYSGSIVSSAVAAALAPNHPSVRGPRFE